MLDMQYELALLLVRVDGAFGLLREWRLAHLLEVDRFPIVIFGDMAIIIDQYSSWLIR